MSTQDWKMENDLCRCCHSEGTFVNLAEPCMRLEKEEIYSEMLQQCLDLNIIPIPGPLCASTYTICPNCILRLRDAFHFKEQVKKCELKFKELYNKDAIKLSSFIEVKLEQDVPNEEPEFITLKQDDAFDTDYDDDGQNVSETEQKPKEESPETARPKRAKTKTQPKAKAVKTRKVKSVQDKAKQGHKVDDYITETGCSPKKYTCKACEAAYRRITDLRYHVNRCHLKQEFIKCNLCSKTFMYHSQRKSHTDAEHAGQIPINFTCSDCGRTFKRKNTLAEHMMDVHIQKKCERCEETFVRKKYLFHLNEAHGVAMPTCGVCGLRSITESSLIRHQRKVHLSEKNKICSVCKKKFYAQSNLDDHMITHNQLKLFSCDVCSKSFARKECLKSHYRLHTGERPYSCRICDVAFVQRASLRFHMKSYHPEPRQITSLS